MTTETFINFQGEAFSLELAILYPVISGQGEFRYTDINPAQRGKETPWSIIAVAHFPERALCLQIPTTLAESALFDDSNPIT
jgi:hypothetical protein